MSVYTVEAGTAVNLAASGDICLKPCNIIGFYVNSTGSGTMNIKNGGSGGTALDGTITPAIGFHRFPAWCGTSAYFTIVSGTLDVTFFFQPQ